MVHRRGGGAQSRMFYRRGAEAAEPRAGWFTTEVAEPTGAEAAEVQSRRGGIKRQLGSASATGLGSKKMESG